MMNTGFVVLILFTLCLVESYPVFTYPVKVKRHTADMKIAQYMACMSIRTVQSKDCRNIGWGLVDIFESGRKKKRGGELPVEIIWPMGSEDSGYQLDDSEMN